EAPLRSARVLGAQPRERPALAPLPEQVVLLGDEVGAAGDRSEHRASERAGRGDGPGGRVTSLSAPPARPGRPRPGPRRPRTCAAEAPSGAPDPVSVSRLSFRAMSSPQRAPRTRSAFAAAFLSLLFPGLGHAYDGAWARALAFATPMLLLIALAGGIVIRVNRLDLLGFLIQPTVLYALFVANAVLLPYRVIAAVEAWQVARYLNEVDASGGGRLGKARLPINPLSVAGLVAVLLVIAAGHLAVARYNSMALSLVNCVFTDTDNPSCDTSNSSDQDSGD